MSTPPRPESLAEIERAVWQQLQAAPVERGHEWRTPVLATVQSDGDGADARTVILREVLGTERRLVFYTDQRAPKVGQLVAHPRATLLMWSRALGWQLRCRVLLGLEMSGLSVTSRWAKVRLTPAAQDYLAPSAPGTPLPASGGTPAPVSAREYFAVISATVESIDWLELHPQGHRRAVFDAAGGRWVQP
jgi:pyridoxamine 5'-phosphate oxidase